MNESSFSIFIVQAFLALFTFFVAAPCVLNAISTFTVQARLAKEKAQCEKEIASMAAKLSNEGFVNKAPAHIVEDMRQKHAAAAEKLAKIEESIRNLG